jgi:hypothetical protein
MQLVHTELVPAGDPSARPAEVTAVDAPRPGLVTAYYRVVAVDRSGIVSAPSTAVPARALDESRPAPPGWHPPQDGPTPGAVVLAWAATPELSCAVERRLADAAIWRPISGWLPPGVTTYIDATRREGVVYQYRLRARDPRGRQNLEFELLTR